MRSKIFIPCKTHSLKFLGVLKHKFERILIVNFLESGGTLNWWSPFLAIINREVFNLYIFPQSLVIWFFLCLMENIWYRNLLMKILFKFFANFSTSSIRTSIIFFEFVVSYKIYWETFFLKRSNWGWFNQNWEI